MLKLMKLGESPTLRYHLLLGILFARIAARPLVFRWPQFLQALDGVLLLAIFVASVLVIAHTRRQALLALAPLVLSVVLLKIPEEPPGGFFLAGSGLAALATFVISGLILREILSHRVVHGRSISGALCVYLLLAQAWVYLYSIADVIEPGSFPELGADYELTSAAGEKAGKLLDLHYFSLVTITTLGYGDITPSRPWAKTLTVCEAVLGQIFLVVLVARLVGLYGRDPDPGDEGEKPG